MKQTILILTILIVLPSCAPVVTSTKLNPSPKTLTPKSPEMIEIFRENKPGKPYVEFMSFRSTEVLGNMESEIIQSLREAAAGIGCDGLIVSELKTTQSTVNQGTSTAGRTYMNGICIVYR